MSDKMFPSLAEVKEALQRKLEALSQEGTEVDSITFSGNGEPTLNPDFAAIVDATVGLRDRFYPSAKISVLSNATMLGREDVFDALRKVDNPILKVDASSDELIAKINKPQGAYSLEKVIDRLKTFDGDFVLQTMFLHSDEFATHSAEALKKWIEIVRQVRPREVMVYTIDRETPDKSLKKCSVEEMTEFVRPLVEEGFNVQIRG
jgi:wyosine [tRNA(Phe)-imidazoG37] synthetase (radical SAM superfamily)